MDTLPKHFSMLLFETAQSWRNLLDQRLKPLGLSQAKWRTLLHLAKAVKPLSQTELATRMGIEGPTLVGLLDRLEQDGWIKRQDSLTDRRSKNVVLTKMAQKTLKQIHAVADDLRSELIASISEEDLKVVINALEKIKGKVEESGQS